jgi:hypothetical protein
MNHCSQFSISRFRADIILIAGGFLLGKSARSPKTGRMEGGSVRLGATFSNYGAMTPMDAWCSPRRLYRRSEWWTTGDHDAAVIIGRGDDVPPPIGDL